jgi:tetratricopeptide (TPR) repeat protein
MRILETTEFQAKDAGADSTSRIPSPVFRLRVLLIALLATVSTPALAQPPDEPSSIESREAVQVGREWAALRAGNLDEEARDPRAAIARYKQFYEARGHLDGTVAVAITSLIAQLYGQGLHDRDKALAIYRWGVQQFAWHPDVVRLERELELAEANSPFPVEPLHLQAPTVTAPAIPTPLFFAPAVPIAPSIPSALKLKVPSIASPALPVALKLTTPRIEAPALDALRLTPPKFEIPELDGLKLTPPKIEAPKLDALKLGIPKVEVPTLHALKLAPPKIEAPALDALKPGMPKIEVPVLDALKLGTSKIDAPTLDALKLTAPKVEAPALDGLKLGTPPVELPRFEVSVPKPLQPGVRPPEGNPAAVPNPLALKLPAVAAPPVSIPSALPPIDAAMPQAPAVPPALALHFPEPQSAAVPAVPTLRVAAPTPAPALPVAPAFHVPLPETPSVAVPSLAAPSVVQPAAAPQVDASRVFARATLLAQLEASPTDADALWQKSGLSLDDLRALAEQANETDAAHQAVRLALAGLLARHNPQLWLAQGLSDAVRLALADYYASVHDEKAVALYEGLLSGAEKAGPQQRGVPALDKLAAYYELAGRPAKAATLLAQVEEYTAAAPQVGNDWVGAARLYRQAGEDEKADALYRKVIETPSEWGWAKGLAIIDQGRTLMRQGKYSEARKLLDAPITGEYAEQIEPVKRMLLGDSYYQSGDLKRAAQNLQIAIDMYHSNPKPLTGEGLENIFASAQERLQVIDKWIEEPIQVSSKKIILTEEENGPAFQPIVCRLQVRTYRDMPITAKVDDENVVVHVVSEDGWDETPIHVNHGECHKEVILEVARKVIKDGLSATLVLGSPQVVNQTKVAIEVKKQ